MKRLTLRRNHSDEAMKRLTMLKNWSDEALHRFNAVNTIYIHAEIAKKQGKTIQNICKGKKAMFFGFAKETTENNEFFGKLPLDSSLHRFYVFINIFFRWSA